MICAGCKRGLEVGDQYIEDSASGFVGVDAAPAIDSLVADILGGDSTLSGGAGGKVVFCEDCTDKTREDGWMLNTYYGDEDDDA